MAGWLESMQGILGPSLSSGGGGSDVGSSIGLVAGSVLGGPAGGALGSQLGGLAGGTPEGSSSAEARTTTTVGDWNVSFGGGKSNLLLIGGAVLLGYLLFFKGK